MKIAICKRPRTSGAGELGHVISWPDGETVFLSEEIKENVGVNKLRVAGLP